MATSDSKRAHSILAGILVAFAVLGTLYSAIVPIFEASDEVWHYPMVEVLARTWQLPVQPLEPGQSSGPWRQEGSQPPLYYAIGALLTSWIDTGDMAQVRHLNPHVKAGEITPERSNVNLVVHDPATERLPWQGTVLAIHVVRLLSVALGTWAVYLTWALVRQIYSDAPWLALAAAAVHAFTPMYLFISSSVNNDNLIVPLSSLALLLIVRRVQHAGATASPGADLRAYAGMGVVLGLALLTKASGLALLPLAGAALIWEALHLPARPSGADRSKFVALRLLVMILPVLAIAGWWFYRNARLYGDWLGLNAFFAVLGTRDVPATLGQLWAERFAFAVGYWGNFGGLNVPLPDWVYAVLNAVALVALAGLFGQLALWLVRGLLQVGRQHLWPLAWDNTTAARALAWAWPAAVFVSWIRWATETWSSQGRLIFSAMPLWSLGLVLGLTAWMPARSGQYRRLPAAALAAFLFIVTVTALPLEILPAYQPPAPMAESEAIALEAGVVPVGVQFGDALELLGYRLSTTTTSPGGNVELELAWRAHNPTPTDHSIFIHLLGAGDRIIAQRDSFPGRGLLATTQLTPGHVWIERHMIPLPSTAYTPDTLEIAVGVYETATGTRLPRTGPEAGSDPELARFGEITLRLEPQTSASHPIEVRFGSGITLIDYDLSEVVVDRGEALTLTLQWLGTAAMAEDYTISVQLIDAQWHKAGQSDAWPLDGRAPTSTWQKGQRLEEERVLEIATDALPGTYDLRIAAYHVTEEGELVHLPVRLRHDTMPTEAVVLTTIRVQ